MRLQFGLFQEQCIRRVARPVYQLAWRFLVTVQFNIVYKVQVILSEAQVDEKKEGKEKT